MTISFIFGDIFKKEVPPCQAQFHIGFYNHVKIKKKQLMSQSQEIVQIVILSILIVTLSLVIALVSLFLHLFVIVSQLNLFLNLLMWTRNVCEWFGNRKSSCQNGFTKPFSAMINFHDVHIFLYLMITFAIIMLTIFSKDMSGVIIFLQISFSHLIVLLIENSTVFLFSIVQISPSVKTNIWEPHNKISMHFLHKYKVYFQKLMN